MNPASRVVPPEAPPVPNAVIFPGQGAAAPGAGEPWRDHPAWQVVDRAEAVLDRPLGRLLLTADAEELATTRASQLAVLLHSLVVWEAAAELLPEPVAFAGHSLGQITALIAAGCVDPDDGFRLAARRADLSQDSADARQGRMAALAGADLDLATRLCQDVDDLWVANDNAPGQVVVAGTAAALEQAAEHAPRLGIRRMRPLQVGHAFHTPLLSDAAEGLRSLLGELPFRAGRAPVVDNTDAAAQADPAVWPAQLTRHLVEPVRWRESQLLLSTEADTFVEVGPGRVLAGLAKRTVPDVTVRNLSHPDDLARLPEPHRPTEATRR